MFDLKKILSEITDLDYKAVETAQERLDSLIKPMGSLGELEEIGKKLSGITGKLYPQIDKRCVLVMVADNGVVEEGVSAAPQSVTLSQTINSAKGITGVSVLAKAFNAEVKLFDIGINADFSHPDIQNKKIRKGTNNIAKEVAMTKEDCLKAIEIGFNAVKNAKDEGYNLIGLGELGMGNTTTSSAVLCGILGLENDQIEKTIGRGAGLTDEGFQKKIDVIKSALELHKPIKNHVISTLHKLGGFDIAAMCGAYIGAAYYKVPVVIDGFISAVAAMCAIKLNPLCKEYMFASHHSFEIGYKIVMKEIGLTPALQLRMRLGEGSGCPIMFSVMDSACAIIKNMGTFAETDITSEYTENIKDHKF